MKKLVFPALFTTLLLLSSCEVVGGIFKAGFYTGVVLIALVLALIIYLFIKFRGGSNR
ncbi:hypothetical protein [Mucilaginibacter sp. CSA2-8R]|uniref:hypothetical protein n=1 Tax=Mucilaginibacter sp. CSA2-8R TaxID=3141542 RepID=UPI00315C8201